MKQKKVDTSAAVRELYRRESDKLDALNAEAEELLESGDMLYRERTLRKAEIVRERMEAIRETAALFGADVERKGR